MNAWHWIISGTSFFLQDQINWICCRVTGNTLRRYINATTWHWAEWQMYSCSWITDLRNNTWDKQRHSVVRMFGCIQEHLRQRHSPLSACLVAYKVPSGELKTWVIGAPILGLKSRRFWCSVCHLTSTHSWPPLKRLDPAWRNDRKIFKFWNFCDNDYTMISSCLKYINNNVVMKTADLWGHSKNNNIISCCFRVILPQEIIK